MEGEKDQRNFPGRCRKKKKLKGKKIQKKRAKTQGGLGKCKKSKAGQEIRGGKLGGRVLAFGKVKLLVKGENLR